MKFVIYGAGTRGEKLIKYIGIDNVVAFIDKDEEKINTGLYNKPVINLNEYILNYSNYFIIISPIQEDEISCYLIENEIYNFSCYNELPSEFSGYGNLKLCEWYSQIKFECEKELILYGLNALSLMLYDYYKTKFKVKITPEKECDINKLNWLNKFYPDIIVNDISNTNESTVLITKYDEYLDCFKLNNKVIDMLDYSSDLPLYYNKTIEKFKNICENKKRCFIVATGPSLTNNDLDVLSNNSEFCISMNTILLNKNNSWRPDVYISTDITVINSIEHLIQEYDCKAKFINASANDFWKLQNEDDVNYKIHVVCDHYTINHKFSSNICQKIYGGWTVTYAAIQLAAYMGFKEIYLLGVDCNYIKYSNNHFIEGIKSTYTDSINDKMTLTYISAKKYADEHGIKIYNATRGGKLEVFPRVDFDMLF